MPQSIFPKELFMKSFFTSAILLASISTFAQTNIPRSGEERVENFIRLQEGYYEWDDVGNLGCIAHYTQSEDKETITIVVESKLGRYCSWTGHHVYRASPNDQRGKGSYYVFKNGIDYGLGLLDEKTLYQGSYSDYSNFHPQYTFKWVSDEVFQAHLEIERENDRIFEREQECKKRRRKERNYDCN